MSLTRGPAADLDPLNFPSSLPLSRRAPACPDSDGFCAYFRRLIDALDVSGCLGASSNTSVACSCSKFFHFPLYRSTVPRWCRHERWATWARALGRAPPRSSAWGFDCETQCRTDAARSKRYRPVGYRRTGPWSLPAAKSGHRTCRRCTEHRRRYCTWPLKRPRRRRVRPDGMPPGSERRRERLVQ